jgi:hypothetical protein
MGATWAAHCVLTPVALVASAAAPVAIAARRLWLRVRCTGGGANNPVLRAVWARWTAGVTAATRRRWTFTVRASDQAVLHDGRREARPARQIVADLEALVGAGPVTFQDVDEAASPGGVTVRVVEVEALVERNLEPRGHEGGVRVTLEEV